MSIADLLLVDDDFVFRTRLKQALVQRGIPTREAETLADVRRCVESKTPSHAVVDLRLRGESGLSVDELDQTDVLPLSHIEWEHINRVLIECGGNVTKAAKILGLHRRSLQRKLKKKGDVTTSVLLSAGSLAVITS